MLSPYKEVRVGGLDYDLSLLPFDEEVTTSGRLSHLHGLGTLNSESAISAMLTIHALNDLKCSQDHVHDEEKKNLLRRHYALPPSERLGLLKNLTTDLRRPVNAPSDWQMKEVVRALPVTHEVQPTTHLRNALVSLITYSVEVAKHTVYSLYHDLLRPEGKANKPNLPAMVRYFMRFLAMDIPDRYNLTSKPTTSNPDGSTSFSTTPSVGKEAARSLTGEGL